MVAEVDTFLTEMLPRQRAAVLALCAGDPASWSAEWSRREPVTLFGGAVPVRTGRADVDRTLGWLASILDEVRDVEYEVIAAGASGDLAYMAGLEHKTVVVDGAEETRTLRVTHVYRREDGAWRVVHRHGDHPPADRERG